MLLFALILCSYRAFIFPLLPDKRVTSRSLFMPPALQMENLKGRILFQTLDGQTPLCFISPICVNVVVHVLRQNQRIDVNVVFFRAVLVLCVCVYGTWVVSCWLT